MTGLRSAVARRWRITCSSPLHISDACARVQVFRSLHCTATMRNMEVAAARVSEACLQALELAGERLASSAKKAKELAKTPLPMMLARTSQLVAQIAEANGRCACEVSNSTTISRRIPRGSSHCQLSGAGAGDAHAAGFRQAEL
jgi:hypothetical protein